VAALQTALGMEGDDPVNVFAHVRKKRDVF